MEDLNTRFEKFEDDFLKFESIEKPVSNRPDLCAFLMLDKLQSGTRDLICASGHDEFFLDIDCEKLNEVISDEEIRDLVRCGIRYEADGDCLCMFA